jgi:ATP-dependent DNA ligase
VSWLTSIILGDGRETTDGPYKPGRRTWLKTKCLNREEFVVVGWSNHQGSRHRIGALQLDYYTPDGKLILPGRQVVALYAFSWS